MTPDEFWLLLRDRWQVVLGTTLLAVLAVVALDLSRTPRFEATATAVVAPTAAEDRSILDASMSYLTQGGLDTVVAIAESSKTSEAVAKELGLELSPAELDEAIHAFTQPHTFTLRITGSSATADGAAALADEALARTEASAEAFFEDHDLGLALAPTSAARVPDAASSPRLTRDVLLAGVAGLSVGLALTMALPRRREEDEVLGRHQQAPRGPA